MQFILTIVGVAFLGIGLWSFLLDLLRYRKAVGIVIGNAEEEGEDGVSYAPRIRFRTADGIDREFRPAVALHSDPMKFGTEIPVRYNPAITWANGVDRWYDRVYLIAVGFVVGSGLLYAAAYLP